MRKFVVGDLHGSIELFNEKLLEIGFNKETDIMYSVGDLIDRGSDSLACLKLIDEPWFKTVLGNHEQFMIESVLHNINTPLWNYNGGIWSMYVEKSILIEYAKKLDKLPLQITVIGASGTSYGICHAEPPTSNWTEELTNIKKCLWGRNMLYSFKPINTIGVDFTVHGHTIVNDIKTIANAYFIDTGAYFTGKLTVMELK